MVCFKCFGLKVAVDFTAPALLALTALMLPERAFLCMLAACFLHESAHFFAIALMKQRPALLRISAAGMQLSLRQPSLCPIGAFSVILAAGAAVNLVAAVIFFRLGIPDAARANLSLGLFNLLPYRSTDGGTLLAALAEHFLLMRHPDMIRRLLLAAAMLTTLLFSLLLFAANIRNPSLWGMLFYMTISEWSD